MRHLCLFAIVLASCSHLDPPALLSQAPPSPGRTAFFDALSAGDYAALDETLPLLNSEFLDGDEASTAVLGFAHAWRLAEYQRVPDDATVVDSAPLAMLAFEQAHESYPDDPRIQGFYGNFQMTTGSIWNDSATQRRGWFDAIDAAKDWPEWGLFNRAYLMSGNRAGSKRYEKAVAFFWDNLDACIDGSVDRDDFDWSEHVMSFVDHPDPLKQRACGNTAVAPHNVEGFFLAFGDVLAKGGDLETATRMYGTAIDHPDAPNWPYRSLAERRLADIDHLEEWFTQGPPESDDPDAPVDPGTVMLGVGQAACVACHQSTPAL